MDIVKIKDDLPALCYSNTGLSIANSFKANSGFLYFNGTRDFGELKIVESVSQGTAIAFLNNIKVFDKSNNLIIDKNLPLKTHYSREKARTVVMDELLLMLEEAASHIDHDFDRFEAMEKIDIGLKKAYYDISYCAVREWAEEIGIKFTQNNESSWQTTLK